MYLVLVVRGARMQRLFCLLPCWVTVTVSTCQLPRCLAVPSDMNQALKVFSKLLPPKLLIVAKMTNA